MSRPLERLSGWLLGAGLFLVYAAWRYPVFAPRDGADMALAALTAGVAHPPGYPLYSLAGKLWLTLVPWGNPALRLNLLSAACGAASAAVLFAWTRRWAGTAAAAASALAFGLSGPVWKFSLLGEKYVLHALFISLLLGLARGGRGNLAARARLSGLLLGLGLVNHQSLVLLLPALIVLWRAETSAQGVSAGRLVPGCAALAILGLMLYAAVAVRLGSWSLAWDVVTRREYGTLELFAGLNRPLAPGLAASLIGHWLRGLAEAGGWIGLALAALGAGTLIKRRDPLGAALLAGLAAFGPLFFLLTRFDLSEWVARSVLESAFVSSCVLAAPLVAAGIKALWERRPGWGRAAALAAVLAPAWTHADWAWHRDDFSAYDYVRNLRRGVPPGAAALVAGDTALFGLRFLEAWQGPSGREWQGAREEGLKDWVASRRAKGPVFVLGLSLKALEDLGLAGNPLHARPAGLAQRVDGSETGPDLETAAWEACALRRPLAFERGDSYSHDVRLSYAFAHYLSALLRERAGQDQGLHPLAAAALDPEDYDFEK